MAGGVVALKTDTLYGLLARADDQAAVERVYQLKSRDETKSPVVLIADSEQLYDTAPDGFDKLYDGDWPDRTTIVLPSVEAPTWIRRSNDSVAYRVPNLSDLRQLLETTGRLIAPSANPQGKPPAENIEQAIEYFGEAVDVYVDGGSVGSARPSQIIKLSGDGRVERLR